MYHIVIININNECNQLTIKAFSLYNKKKKLIFINKNK